jgi:hypothetical protein
MNIPKSTGGSLDTRNYLARFDGLDIEAADPQKPDDENQTETIVLDTWVRHDFKDMGAVVYTEVDPP